mmetsp:Transcript_21858/g.72246  ORF Transcript_21858/g.72246 Transcript_21858/m.72246 type:complete len:203 (+) Transcript_21858:367-975(+)
MPGLALQCSEAELLVLVMVQHEVDRCVAEVADTVEEDDVVRLLVAMGRQHLVHRVVQNGLKRPFLPADSLEVRRFLLHGLPSHLLLLLQHGGGCQCNDLRVSTLVPLHLKPPRAFQDLAHKDDVSIRVVEGLRDRSDQSTEGDEPVDHRSIFRLLVQHWLVYPQLFMKFQETFTKLLQSHTTARRPHNRFCLIQEVFYHEQV